MNVRDFFGSNSGRTRVMGEREEDESPKTDLKGRLLPPPPPAEMFGRDARDYIATFDFKDLLRTQTVLNWPRPSPQGAHKSFDQTFALSIPVKNKIAHQMGEIAISIAATLREAHLMDVECWHRYPNGFASGCLLRVRITYIPILLLPGAPIFEALRRKDASMLKEAVATASGGQLDSCFDQISHLSFFDGPQIGQSPLEYAPTTALKRILLEAGAAIEWDAQGFHALDSDTRKLVSSEWERRVRRATAAVIGVGKRHRWRRDELGLIARAVNKHRHRYERRGRKKISKHK